MEYYNTEDLFVLFLSGGAYPSLVYPELRTIQRQLKNLSGLWKSTVIMEWRFSPMEYLRKGQFGKPRPSSSKLNSTDVALG